MAEHQSRRKISKEVTRTLKKMKLTAFIIFSIIFTFQCNSANCRLHDLFDGLHNKLHKANEDIHNIIFPTEKEPNTIYHDRNEQNPYVRNNSDNPVNQEVKQIEAVTQTSSTEKIIIPAPSTETTSTTEKGRENFSGNCLPGYFRTPDGRCKAAF